MRNPCLGELEMIKPTTSLSVNFKKTIIWIY